MRKTILLIILIAVYINTATAQIDTKKTLHISGGVKAEANWSKFIVSNMPDGDSSMKTGFTGGGFLNLDISNEFAVQGELLFHYKSSDLSRDGLKGKFEYWGCEIPMYALYKINLKNSAIVYIGGGPYTEFGFSAELKRGNEKIDLYEKEQGREISHMRDNNTGFGFLAGYEFPCGIQINATYKVSFLNIIDPNSSSVKLYPAALSIGAGYRFNK